MEESMLTTIDNPYNPFTQYELWYNYDAQMGYHTPEYLARITVLSDGLSPADQQAALEQGVAEALFYNFNGLYCRVTRENFNEMMAKFKKDIA